MLCIECKSEEVASWGTEYCPRCIAKHEPQQKKLTDRQYELLCFLADYIRNFLATPSYRECADAMGIKPSSRGALFHHFTALEQKGYVVRRTREQKGTIFPTPKMRREFGLLFEGHDVNTVSVGKWQDVESMKGYR